jgi:hypothetical protein
MGSFEEKKTESKISCLGTFNEQSHVEDISMHLRLYVEHSLEREKNEMMLADSPCLFIKNVPSTFHRLPSLFPVSFFLTITAK